MIESEQENVKSKIPYLNEKEVYKTAAGPGEVQDMPMKDGIPDIEAIER